MVVAVILAEGCGGNPATPPAAAPATDPAKAGAAPAAANAGGPTNRFAAYVSVYEDLLPPQGKDPFFPMSHRRDKVADAPTEAPPPPVDAILSLKAIIRTSRHSQAVVNNEIMEEGEAASVRVPNGKVKVHCIHIGKNYVDVQVDGEAGPKRLFMQQKKD